jgi:hypothetical protein
MRLRNGGAHDELGASTYSALVINSTSITAAWLNNMMRTAPGPYLDVCRDSEQSTYL